jgi:hypothetical protein
MAVAYFSATRSPGDPYTTLLSVRIGGGSIGSLHHSVPSWLGPLVRPVGPCGPTGVA